MKMYSKEFAMFLLLVAVFYQVGSTSVTEQQAEEDSAEVLFPWRQKTVGSSGLQRAKRAWVIPPINIPENTKQIPKNVVQIKSDTLEPGKVLYKIQGPGVDEDPKGFFEINETTGWVILMNVLDRETHSKFKIKAYALDLSGKPMEDPTELEIHVVDQNDNRPAFVQEEFTGRVHENSKPGTSVMQVEATDADDIETDNAALAYSIIGQESIPPFRINKTMFGIDELTGIISTRDVGLDREEVEGFNITLQVADMSGSGLTSYSSALIYINDVNDNAPNFTSEMFQMSVMENKVQADIGRITVTDEDEPQTENWWVKYTITAGDPEGNFDIRRDDATNEGIVSVVKLLDYESLNYYELVVMVENESPLSLMGPKTPPSSATVTINVLNQNEPPGFRQSPLRLSVPEGSPAGTLLASNIALDPDRQALRYDVEYDPDQWLFLDDESGEITANKEITKNSRFLTKDVYMAVITVEDTGDYPSTATATVYITVLEVNDFAPEPFSLSKFMCNDPEKGSGLVLSATDKDQPPHSAPFLFSLDDSEPENIRNWTLHRINDTHAALRLLSAVVEGEYVLPVVLSDSGTPALAEIHMVNVTVCHCNNEGDCQPILAAIFSAGMGLSLGALLIILGSIVLLLLLLLIMAAVEQCRRRPIRKGMLGISDDDIRDNILNYDEQGGGEEDENAYNMDQLRNPNEIIPPPTTAMPRGKQPVRKDTPYNYPSPSYPRKTPADPIDIEDFINDGLDAADKDPNVPPYDTALIYDFEGDGSLAGSLSSIASGSSDGDQDYDYLNSWGPRFNKLANLYDKH
ncbi:cadherin-15-like [Huso huso]|uniref:Cadherin-15-like n=1 Tax=Huso huso TaxID=61971 RepID=A0ABR0YX26_HUSHU